MTRRKNKAKNNKSANVAAKQAAPDTSMHSVVSALRVVGQRLEVVEKLSHAPVVVDRKDCKKDNPIRSLLERRGLMKMGSGRFSRNAPLRVLIAEQKSQTSSTATALTAAISLFPFNTADAVGFATVYDVGRCTGIRWHASFNVTDASGIPGGPTVTAFGAVAYDPANSGVYASVAQVIEGKFHIGPFPLSTYGGQTGGPFPCNQITFEKHVQIPRLVDPGLVTDLLDSNWVSASDTSVLVGYVKPYLESCGAARQTQLNHFFVYEMEFAFRT